MNVVALADEPPRFDLRTWLVADPRPDDPAPSPGLVVEGDLQSAFPAEPRPFVLGWSGVGGEEPLRGLVTWHEGRGGGEPLATTTVEVRPAGGR